MNIYIQQFEQIVREMMGTVSETSYQPWLHFLYQIHPESELLKNGAGASQARDPTEESDGDSIKECQDIRELMMLAEKNNYPTWRIQPHKDNAVYDSIHDILFPTNQIQTIPSNHLEELFQKYLATLREQGIDTDRILISGDKQIFDTNGNAFSHLIYQPIILH